MGIDKVRVNWVMLHQNKLYFDAVYGESRLGPVSIANSNP